jgi:hypothetical protein
VNFTRSHNLVVIGQLPLFRSFALSISEEVRSRVTASVVLPRLAPERIETVNHISPANSSLPIAGVDRSAMMASRAVDLSVKKATLLWPSRKRRGGAPGRDDHLRSPRGIGAAARAAGRVVRAPAGE